MERAVSLRTFLCSGNNLNEIDVKDNKLLDTLDLSGNKLQDIDISANTRLTSLDISDNALVNLISALIRRLFTRRRKQSAYIT